MKINKPTAYYTVMKKPYYPLPLALLAAYFLLMAAASCNKENENEGDYLPYWFFSFILTDSTGNNLLPSPLPDNPPFQPKDFWAYSEVNSNIGKWNEAFTNSDSAQIVFRASEEFQDIERSPLYQADSMFVWYFCFGQQCDTLLIYPENLHNPDNMGLAKKIIWGGDTFYNHKGSRLRIHKKF